MENKNDCKAMFNAITDLIMNDDEFVDEYLIDNGYDPEKLAQEGREFLGKLKEKLKID